MEEGNFRIVSDIANISKPSKEVVNAVKDSASGLIKSIDTDGNPVYFDNGIGSKMIYAEVSISSAEILAMGTTPVIFVLQPAAGFYLDTAKVILEYTHVTTPYTLATSDFLNVSGNISLEVEKGLLTGPKNVQAILNVNDGVNVASEITFSYAGDAADFGNITLTTYDGSNPTLGDGTLLAKIWYQIQQVGTQL